MFVWETRALSVTLALYVCPTPCPSYSACIYMLNYIFLGTHEIYCIHSDSWPVLALPLSAVSVAAI